MFADANGPQSSQFTSANSADGEAAFTAARDLSTSWVAAPSGTGGSHLLDSPTWALMLPPLGPGLRPLAGFEPKAILGFSVWDLTAPRSELLQQTDSPVPLPPAFWTFGSGALLLGLWSRRRSAGASRPNEGHAS
jgi:hypothetical protein